MDQPNNEGLASFANQAPVNRVPSREIVPPVPATPVPPSNTTPLPPLPPVQSVPPSQPARPNKPSKMMWAIVIILLLLVSASAYAYYFRPELIDKVKNIFQSSPTPAEAEAGMLSALKEVKSLAYAIELNGTGGMSAPSQPSTAQND